MPDKSGCDRRPGLGMISSCDRGTCCRLLTEAAGQTAAEDQFAHRFQAVVEDTVAAEGFKKKLLIRLIPAQFAVR